MLKRRKIITVGNEGPGWFGSGLYQDGGLTGIARFARPGGKYYTSGKVPVGQEYSERTYFAGLMSGRRMIGDLVFSVSTGKKLAIVAGFVGRDGKVVGGPGASVFLDDLSEWIEAALSLAANPVFFALGDGLPTPGR